jgi:hypothetical protein
MACETGNQTDVNFSHPIDSVEEFPSPGGTQKAVLYRVDIRNALADYSWQICILPAGESLSKWRRPVFITDGDLIVSPRWTDSSHLLVVYGPPSGNDKGGGAGRQITSFGGVKIAYHYVP